MMAVLGDPAWQAKMAELGPPQAARYDWRSVTQQYLDLMIPLVA
jgi:hypothetical protein